MLRTNRFSTWHLAALFVHSQKREREEWTSPLPHAAAPPKGPAFGFLNYYAQSAWHDSKPKLASGVNLHAFIAKTIEEKSGRGGETTGDLEFEAVDEARA